MNIDLFELGDALMTAASFEKQFYRMRDERDYWKEEYNKLLNSGLQHQQIMMGNFINLALNSGEDAIKKAFEG